MEWLKFGLDIAGVLVPKIIEAFQHGDDAITTRSIDDILGHELRLTIAKRLADIRAAEKFGG